MYLDVYFPKTNPILFDMNEYHSYQDVALHESHREFIQQFTETDRLSFQFQVRYDQVFKPTCELSFIVNGNKFSYGNLILEGNRGDYPSFFYKGNGSTNSGTGVVCFSLPINEIKINGNQIITNKDDFQIEIKISGNTTKIFTSNKIKCCNETYRTKLLHYSQSSKEGDINFSTFFYYMPKGYDIRLPAEFLHVEKKANKSVFQTYKGDFELISSFPYETVKLIIGAENALGVPDWLISNLNFIFHLDEKEIDGVRYELTDNSEFEVERYVRYNNRIVSIELSKKEDNWNKVDGSVIGTAFKKYTENDNTKGQIVVKYDDKFYITGSNALLDYTFSEISGKGNSVIDFSTQKNIGDVSKETVVKIVDYKTDEIIQEIPLTLPPARTGICFGKLCDTFYIG